MRICLAVLALMLAALSLHAGEALPLAQDEVTEKRLVAISSELRCLVCQNQSLADSHADLAVDLRRQIREQIAQGKSDASIIAYMVERYGEFVLYRPPMRAATWLLWFGPPLLLVMGIVLLLRYVRARRARIEIAPFTDAEHQAAQALLVGDESRQK